MLKGILQVFRWLRYLGTDGSDPEVETSWSSEELVLVARIDEEVGFLFPTATHMEPKDPEGQSRTNALLMNSKDGVLWRCYRERSPI